MIRPEADTDRIVEDSEDSRIRAKQRIVFISKAEKQLKG